MLRRVLPVATAPKPYSHAVVAFTSRPGPSHHPLPPREGRERGRDRRLLTRLHRMNSHLQAQPTPWSVFQDGQSTIQRVGNKRRLILGLSPRAHSKGSMSGGSSRRWRQHRRSAREHGTTPPPPPGGGGGAGLICESPSEFVSRPRGAHR